jgi:hypothetical protein
VSVLDWTDLIRRGALSHGSGAPADDPGIVWARYLNDDDGSVWVWNGDDWVQLSTVGGGGGGSTDGLTDTELRDSPVGITIGDDPSVEQTVGPVLDGAGAGFTGWFSRIVEVLLAKATIGNPDYVSQGASDKDIDSIEAWTADGHNTALGTTTQTKATDGSATAWSLVQLLKGIFDKLLGTINVAETATALQASNTTSTAYENSKQIKAAAGWLFGFSVRNKSLTTTLYVGLYNAASKTGTPVQRYRVDPDDETYVPFGPIGRYFTTGIFLQGMTVGEGTDTSDSSSSLWFDASYQ